MLQVVAIFSSQKLWEARSELTGRGEAVRDIQGGLLLASWK